MPGSTFTSSSASARSTLPKSLALSCVLAIGIGFVLKYVFHYYLNYNPQGFTDEWPKRGTLLVHITCGMVALLTGPWQFSSRLRRRYLSLHRLTGRVYACRISPGYLDGGWMGMGFRRGNAGSGMGDDNRNGLLCDQETADPRAQGVDGKKLRGDFCIRHVSHPL
jgi:Predicted membrane protein (DUF2306)